MQIEEDLVLGFRAWTKSEPALGVPALRNEGLKGGRCHLCEPTVNY